MTLKEIVEIFSPRGFFLSVSPGTQFVSVGGAIAADIHGKNHHHEGTFCDHVISMQVLLASGEIIECSPQENSEIFHGISGGMGLLGIVLEATFRLKKISSVYISQQTYKAKNLEHIMELFAEHQHETYSVAWIDCLSSGKKMGRSLLMVGEHADLNDLKTTSKFHHHLHRTNKTKLSVPIHFPNFALNKWSIQAFNFLYYNKQIRNFSQNITHYQGFFYPLDSIYHWNRIYGKRGFTQYQFVLPLDNSAEGLTKILTKIHQRGQGSFLAVLKLFGKGNNNLLSFPIEGYTLALDFPIMPGLEKFFGELDQVVMDLGGRIYLAKDVFMSKEVFHQTYGDQLVKFRELKKRLDPENKFQSLQSQRLGI